LGICSWRRGTQTGARPRRAVRHTRLDAPRWRPAGPHTDLFVGVDLLVTLDDDGNLARIVVTSAPGDPEPVLDLDITQIGEPQAIAPPDTGTLARVEESP
jgi:hypothetical protein